jgi:hypothetical protein
VVGVREGSPAVHLIVGAERAAQARVQDQSMRLGHPVCPRENLAGERFAGPDEVAQ